MRVDDEFRETENLTTQVECVTESRLLTLFGCQRLHWFQVEVVVQVEVVQVFTMDEQVEHVVALSANLKTCFDPIQCCRLENLFQLDIFKNN
jgi:hypothetical protein